MKKSNMLILLLPVLLCPIIASSQVDSASIEKYIYNKVYKNIAAHNIRFASFANNGAIYKPILKTNTDAFYDPFLPDVDWKLKMEIEKMKWKYPVQGFDLYKIYIDGFKYIDSKGNEKKIFGVWTDRYFLVALNKETEDIKFISGQFFINAISEDFKVDENDPFSFLEYLKYRTFRYQVRDIKFIKKKHNRYYYDGYSDSLNGRIKLIVYLNELEEPRVIAFNEKDSMAASFQKRVY